MYEESVATIFQLDTDYPYKGCIGKGWLKTLHENDPHKQGNNIISRTMHGFHANDTMPKKKMVGEHKLSH